MVNNTIAQNANDAAQIIGDSVPLVKDIIAEVKVSKIAGKIWYQSKTIWTNVISIIALVIQMKYGFVVSPEYQMLILTTANLILRGVTSSPITLIK
jgi:hypothetical protein